LGDNIPLAKSHLAEFPFLPQAKQYIARLDIDFAELSTLKPIVDRAKQRVTASFVLGADKPSKNLDVEITSFPVAIMMVAGTKDNSLRERYALFEAKKMAKFLLDEKNEIILEIAKFFEWDIHHHPKRAPYPYTIHFVNYLNNATRGRLVYDLGWKLVNRRVLKGQVDVSKREVCRLLQEEIKIFLERRSEQEIPQVPQITVDVINEIKTKYLQIKPHITEIDKIRVFAEESEYPPCIQSLYDRMTKGQHLSHIERFTLVTYLLHQGISVDAVTNLFTSITDFREDLTRYQVEHLAGKKGTGTVYNPPNCATLRTHGVCINPDDSICKTIKNPLTYHLRKKSIQARAQ
jgi:DNA primase large subunit